MIKKVVYTAIFGGKDTAKNMDICEDVDYILFTDDPNLESDQFKIHVVPPLYDDPVRSAKYYKILAHRIFPSYLYSLWIDGSIQLSNVDLHQLFDQYLKEFDLAFHLHPIRDCIYAEAEKCIELGKDNPEIIKKQMAYYRSQNYPEHAGLISGGIIFRNHTKMVKRFNEAWWNEICKHSRRDQLSLPYVLRKLDIEIFSIPGHVRNRNVDGFMLHRHIKADYRNW